MKRATIIVSIFILALTAVNALPSFPLEWQSDQTAVVALYQGGTKEPDGSVCCPLDGSAGGACKVQTMGQAGVQYTDGENNRTRFDSQAQGLIVDWLVRGYDFLNLSWVSPFIEHVN